MYEINVDPTQQLVHVILAGMFDEDEVKQYTADLRSQFITKIGARPYVLLLDSTRLQLQPQAIVELFQRQIVTFPKATRIALVNGNSIARMQLRRVLTRDYARFFRTIDEALPWLINQWPPVADGFPDVA